jgi:hypothetical protein
MATARSLQGVDWLIRTYAQTLLNAVGRSSEATTLRGGQTINSTARLTAAVTRLNTFEAAVRADMVDEWADSWQGALDTIFARVVAQLPIPLDEMLADADANVKRAIKTALRALELRACQFVAGGGGL